MELSTRRMSFPIENEVNIKSQNIVILIANISTQKNTYRCEGINVLTLFRIYTLLLQFY